MDFSAKVTSLQLLWKIVGPNWEAVELEVEIISPESGFGRWDDALLFIVALHV